MYGILMEVGRPETLPWMGSSARPACLLRNPDYLRIKLESLHLLQKASEKFLPQCEMWCGCEITTSLQVNSCHALLQYIKAEKQYIPM